MAKIIGKIRKPSGRKWYHLCYYATDFSDILVNGVSVGKITSVEGLSEEEAAQELVYNVEYILNSNVISTQGLFQGIYMLEEAELYGITETSQYCFSGAGIKSLYIDGSLSNLANNTFIYCPLEHIEIDSSNQKYVSEGGCLIRKSTLGDFLHYGTSNAVIPDSVTSIGSYAFYQKTFETIEIPRSVKTLNSTIFEGSKLKYITIPDSVNYMWVSVFEGCDYLKYVNFGDETNHNFNFTSTWGRSMFDGCPNLERINFYGDTLPEIYNNETNGYENTFYGIAEGGVLGVKEGVDTTPWFSGEYNLGTYNWTVGEIEIPELEYTYTMVYDVNTTDEIYLFGQTNTLLGEDFHTLSELEGWVKTIYIDGVDVGITPTYSFPSTGEHSVVLVTSGFNLPNKLFYCNEYLTSIIFPDTNIRFISEEVFKGCKNLKTVVLPNKLFEIGVGAFASCSSLENITIPSNVTEIDYDAFIGCSSLMQITCNAPTAPSIGTSSMYHTFTVPKYGTLYYPAGSDYSTWLNKTDKVYNLGYYDWNGVEVHPDGEILTPDTTMEISADGETFKYTIEAEHIQTYIQCRFSNFISVERIDMYNFNITVQANNGNERQGEVYFEYQDYNGNILNHILTITQDEKYIPDGEIVTPNKTMTIVTSGKTFQYTIETNNIKHLLAYYIYFNGDRYLDTIDGFISIEKVDMNNFNITVEENEGDERKCSIIFQYRDYKGNSLTHTLNIVQDAKPEEEPDEPDVPPTPDEPAEPSYVILSKNDITLNGEGDTKDVSVTYTNMGEIIIPEVPEGYEIEEVSREDYEGNNTQVVYRIKKVSKNKGNFILNFTGKDAEGNVIKSEDLNVEGKASSTEPAKVYFSTAWLDDNGGLIFEYTGGTKRVQVIVEGYTKPYNITWSVNDDNYLIHCSEKDVYDDEVNYAVINYNVECEPNDDTTAKSATITFKYTDANTTWEQTIPIYIEYEGEGAIYLGSNNYIYDKDGELKKGYEDIGVRYREIATIGTPIYNNWITLGDAVFSGGYNEDGTMKKDADGAYAYRYDISVAANTGEERKGTVTFRGTGNDGKNYSIVLNITQEGENTEPEPVDEGFIELQQLSVQLMADGSAQTFQVKYYDAKTIYEPELEFDWATITEVSRTEPTPDVAWNGEECDSVIVTYKVTAEPTESGRQMRVKFLSDINYYDGGVVHMEKDKFAIYQLAEGSTEFQGVLRILRKSNEYTYYGSPIGFQPKVGYTDLVPDTPIISANWCRVASINDETTKEYDYLKEYVLELDTNNSNFSRTCTITFVGNAEDGTDVRGTFTITQQGQNEIFDEGEYSNYKGYFRSLDDILYSVSFITNPRSDIYGDIRLAGDSPVVVSYSESDRLFTPLRTSTCTVKVVSDKYLMNLYSGKAHGTQVILRNEDADSVEWCGFLQPNLYNQGFTECYEEIEFEASDCLQTLQYFEYKEHFSNGRFTVSFKDIINDIMYKCGILESYYITQKPYSDGFTSRYVQFQNFYIPEENFFSEEGEPWTYQEVLEEICKFLGVVCFQWKDDLYFIDYDRYQTNKSMKWYRWDKSDNWQTMNYITLSTPNQIVEESYKETGADISLDDVFNKVSVNCNYYNFENLIPDLFDDDKLSNRFEDNAYISISRYTADRNSALETQTYYRIYDHDNVKSRYYLPVTSTSYHEQEVTPTDSDFTSRYFFSRYVGGNIVDMVHLNYNEANGKVGEAKDWERYLMISQLNRPWCGAEGTFHWENYNFPIMEFKNLPVVFIDNDVEEDTDTPTRASSSSSSTPNNRQPYKKTKPAPNYIVIKGEAIFTGIMNREFFEGMPEGLGKKSSQSWYTYNGDSIDHVRNTPALCFYLEIPQAGWWNGSTWVDYKTHFEVPLEYFGDGSDDNKYYEHLFGVSKSVENTVETNLFLGTTGYKIPLPKEMTTTQELYFAIAMPKRFVHCSDSYGGDNSGDVGNAYCFIKELEVKVCNRNSIFFKNEDAIFENIIDEGNVIEGEEISLKITSDNYEGFSYSHVSTIRSDNKNSTDISFYNKDMKLVKAEEAIISKYVNQYSTPSIKENVTLDMSFLPTQLITDTYWDKDFVIVGQQIDYQHDRQKLTLLEKK